jgi:serine/threonine protein kinase/Tol biopolymer transport system component
VKTLDKIRQIFCEAVEKPTEQERKAYLDKACRDNPSLRAEIDALLKAHYGEDDLLGGPILGSPADSPIAESPGTTIDKYKLLEKIGEGGMAVVYMAEQERPIRRKVALKIIKLGMDTRQVIARFEVERQALAMMDHPNIAKVLDAGATETGRPYFVMELVTGVSITEYCDKNNLSTKDRLGLFLQVCSAVQHAHQKGIIHRDIKPTNVMVTHHDGKPVPKVIDFGIAKAINQRLTEKTLFTRYAHIIGTPAYMSPEQAEMSDVDVDTRTDIYSLGVLLYELLTGATPFGEEELRKAGYIEMQRIIRETEPLKPSTKLSTMGDSLAGVAEHRKTNPDLLAKLVRGDLDWIVMKSLEKDRARRYEAADRLALDIQRHLEHRPVLAHAPSTTYRLHKFLRRHRSQAIAALAVVVVAGTITILSIRNRYQVRLAEAEGARQVNALSEARRLIASGDLAAARKTLRPILESEHAGLEARILFAGVMVDGHDPDEALNGTQAVMERHYRERVQYYSEKIQANPTDASNYLQRAKQYHYLHEEQNVYADIGRYEAILLGSRSLDFRFGMPVSLKSVIPVLDGASDIIGCFSHDGLEMYIGSERPGGREWDLWVSKRASIVEDWGPLENPGTLVNSLANEAMPSISADGLTVYFSSERSGGYGSADIYMTTRVTRDAPWGQVVNMGPKINSSNADLCPWISADGLELYFESYLRAGGYGGDDIYVARRATQNDPWGDPVSLGPILNSAYEEHGPSLSPDGLLLFFSDRYLFRNMPRPGGYGNCDIWMTRRASRSDPWQAPVNLGPQVNGSASDVLPRISPDGNMLYFCSDRGGNWNNYQVPILPVVDVNTEGIVK